MSRQGLFLLAAWIAVLGMNLVGNASPEDSISVTMESTRLLDGVAGDFVTVSAWISNLDAQPVDNVTTYLSLVDTADSLPVDLEDWSAEKGLLVGTIESGQTLPLAWKIHFVKPGRYALMVVALSAGQERATVSDVIRFEVRPKASLNPAHVLPVALATPIVVGFLLLVLNYGRRTRPLGKE
jgi:hypothetical protein